MIEIIISGEIENIPLFFSKRRKRLRVFKLMSQLSDCVKNNYAICLLESREITLWYSRSIIQSNDSTFKIGNFYESLNGMLET